jgi:type VI secretion system protein ImpC
MRLPYGPRTDAIESFKFEEMTSATDHEAYLWGNPALACGMVLAARFLDEPTDMRTSGPLEIEDLPACVRDIDGERQLMPCAEVLLPIRVGEELQRRGMIALLSHSDRNAVRILELRSVAEPTLALAGLA